MAALAVNTVQAWRPLFREKKKKKKNRHGGHVFLILLPRLWYTQALSLA